MKTAKPGLKKGFTLIEVLFSIAIIGILAAITSVFLSNHRMRAKDAQIKSVMSQMQRQAEVFQLTHGSFIATGVDPLKTGQNDTIRECNGTQGTTLAGTVFDVNAQDSFGQLATEVYLKSPNSSTIFKSGTNYRPWCVVRANGWAFGVALNDVPKGQTKGKYGWCVDSTGTQKIMIANYNSPDYLLFSPNPPSQSSSVRCR